MWELDHKEHWALKNWCFWIAVLEKTLENPLDCKEIQQVHSKGDRHWIFIGGLMLKLQYFGHLMQRRLIGKDPDAGKDWGQEEKWVAENEMIGWHHQRNGHGFEQTLGYRRMGMSGVLQSMGSQRVRWLSDWTTTVDIHCKFQVYNLVIHNFKGYFKIIPHL